MNVTTKIDTSDSANPRPEVELQIAKNISLELAVVLGTPPPGTNFPIRRTRPSTWRFVAQLVAARPRPRRRREHLRGPRAQWQYRY